GDAGGGGVLRHHLRELGRPVIQPVNKIVPRLSRWQHPSPQSIPASLAYPRATHSIPAPSACEQWFQVADWLSSWIHFASLSSSSMCPSLLETIRAVRLPRLK